MSYIFWWRCMPCWCCPSTVNYHKPCLGEGLRQNRSVARNPIAALYLQSCLVWDWPCWFWEKIKLRHFSEMCVHSLVYTETCIKWFFHVWWWSFCQTIWHAFNQGLKEKGNVLVKTLAVRKHFEVPLLLLSSLISRCTSHFYSHACAY